MKGFVKYLLIGIILLVVVALVYLKVSFLKPTVTSIENIQLTSFTDSGSAMVLTVKINNPNPYSIQMKDLEVNWNQLVNGSTAKDPITLPSKSENIYQIPVAIQFGKIDDLLNSVAADSSSIFKVHLFAKPSFWFSYLEINETISGSASGNMIPELFSSVFKENVTLKKIHWPQDISAQSVDVTFDMEIKNPYDLELQLKNYQIQIFEDSSKTTLLGQLMNNEGLLLSPRSTQLIANKLTIKPLASAMNAALRMLQGNLTYFVLVNGNVQLAKFQTDFSHSFIIDPFKLSQ